MNKYYINGNEIMVIEPHQIDLVQDNWVKMTDKEVEAFLNPVPIIDEAKTLKINEINNACENTIVSGFKSFALGSDYFYYSTIEEQTNLNSIINLGINSNFKCQRISLVNEVEVKESRVQVPHTLAQLRQVLTDGAIYRKNIIDKKDLLETQIKNATTVQELDGINW